MSDLNSIKKEIVGMSKVALEMWQLAYRVFMEQDVDLIKEILKKEGNLNKSEEEITAKLIALGRTFIKKEERTKIIIYADIVGDLEMIGDYCKDILERVQIKIEEKLLFSDDAVKEYTELYNKAEKALKEVTLSLEKDNPSLVKGLLGKDKDIEVSVDEYRHRHNQRMIDGICTPLACNMFLNMLDFTASIYHHTQKIAQSLLKIKK
jgi:phosphate:Na+ symporter